LTAGVADAIGIRTGVFVAVGVSWGSVAVAAGGGGDSGGAVISPGGREGAAAGAQAARSSARMRAAEL
ncbi:MAG TPA: hypothetical protein VI776_17790, partial [Anaerolineales bacterium]|nr:hypothetical protein [Anaerolineales bacterium]